MKRTPFIIALVLVFCLGMMAGGVGFADDEHITVWINGERLNASPGPRLIDGRVFVPLRAVSESMGASVGWDSLTDTAYIATQRDALTDIEIIGPPEFQKAMRDALELLRDKSPEDYAFVGMYVRKITMDSNIKSAATRGYDMDMHITSDYGIAEPVWWSAALVHEAMHIMFDYNAIKTTTESEEIEANKKDIQVLQKLNAPQWMIEHKKNVISTKWWEESPFK